MSKPTGPAPDYSLTTDRLRALGEVSSKLIHELRAYSTSPEQRKLLQKQWRIGEVAKLLGISESSLRNHDEALRGGEGNTGGAHRRYSLSDIHRLRELTHRQAHRDPLRDRCARLAVCNFKGGSGKSTTATNLATHLVLHGYRTLFIDMDPQGSATALLYPDNLMDIQRENTLYEVLFTQPERIRDLVIQTAWQGLDMIPAALSLFSVEAEILRYGFSNPDFLFWERLDRALGHLQDDYDVILFDTPPSLSQTTVIAAWSATALVIPVQASMMDLQAMASFFFGMWQSLSAIEQITGETKHYDFGLIVISNYRGNPKTMQDEYDVATWIRKMYQHYVAEDAILNSSVIRSAANSIQIFYELPRRSDPSYARALGAFEGLGDQIIGLIRRQWPSTQTAATRTASAS